MSRTVFDPRIARRLGGCAAAIALALLVNPHVAAESAPAPTLTNGATRGLQPKFIDVKVFGTTIKTRYYEAGQGEPMVLVHGGGFHGYYSANHWDKVIPGFGKKFHVFAADKLAAGMTDNPPDDKDLNIKGEMEHMYQFIQTMKLGKVHLIGQSRGAGLVLFLAVTHPDVVKTLVLVDSGTASPDEACPNCTRIPRDPCPTGNRFELWKCVLRNLAYRPDVAFDQEYWAAGKYMADLPKAQQTVARLNAAAGQNADNGVNFDWNGYKKELYARLRKETLLPFPVLLYWAVNDPQAPAFKNGVMLYDIIADKHPNARLNIVNKASHFWWREYPEEFVYGVSSFIDFWTRPSAGATR